VYQVLFQVTVTFEWNTVGNKDREKQMVKMQCQKDCGGRFKLRGVGNLKREVTD
jgi:hypothetical protein